MTLHTILVEFPDDGPSYHKGMEVLGGHVIAVNFSDALAELERVKELCEDLTEALSNVVSWVPGPQHWHTDAPACDVRRARDVLNKVRNF
jgi:hypothetical protein